MLNSGWNGGYKSIAKKVDARECSLSTSPLSELVVDFRSRLFRYVRLAYCNRSSYDRARSVFRTMRDLRLVGKVVTEKRRVFIEALAVTRKEAANFSCTYVFPSPTACPHKAGVRASRAAKTSERFAELERRMALYRRNMFDMDALQQCALALESYVISDLDGISTMYSGKEWLLGVGRYKVPGSDDHFESDRLCAKLASSAASPSEGSIALPERVRIFADTRKNRGSEGAAVLSEDFDNVVLFGTDMMVKEIFSRFFVYVSLKDTMAALNSTDRTDAVRKCCLLGTDYNRGLKGIGPVKVAKIDAAKAKKLFETCVAAQSIKPEKLHELFMLP